MIYVLSTQLYEIPAYIYTYNIVLRESDKYQFLCAHVFLYFFSSFPGFVTARIYSVLNTITLLTFTTHRQLPFLCFFLITIRVYIIFSMFFFDKK